MFQNDLLDLAIGLVFVWFVLSLVISVVNEGFVLVFRIRAKHLWLAVGRILDPVNGRNARHFWDTVIHVPFAKLLGKDFDVRPVARPSSADQPMMKKPDLPSGSSEELQKIYDAMAPMIGDVAKVGRKSKLTSIRSEVFADAVAVIARRVRPNDLKDAAQKAGWSAVQLQQLESALSRYQPDEILSLTETLALKVPAERTEANKHALYVKAINAVLRKELKNAARLAGWDEVQQRQLATALEAKGDDTVIAEQDTVALSIPDRTEADKQDLYTKAREAVQVRGKDLKEAASARWSDDQQRRLAIALDESNDDVVITEPDTVALNLGSDRTDTHKRSLYATACNTSGAEVRRKDLKKAAASAGWTETDQERLKMALEGLVDVTVIDQTDTEGLNLGSDITVTDMRDLYLKASNLSSVDQRVQSVQPVSVDQIADVFDKNPALADAIRKAAEAPGVTDPIVAAKRTVAAWFDREMEQLSAMYRRQSRLMLGVLAIPVVLIFQANTLGIISDLRSDAALRESIVNQAITTVDAGSIQAIIDERCPDTTQEDPVVAAAKKFECAGRIVLAAQKSALILPDLDKLRALDPDDDPSAWRVLDLSWSDVFRYEIHDYGVFGRLITLVALLFGAQFWFDVLRRLVGIRKTLTGGGGSAAG